MYSRSSVSSDGKFPPTPSKTYINLAVVERASQIRDLEEVRKNTLHGRVDKLLEGKTKIELTDILRPQEDGSPVSLVFVEGPPGIGKSTLAWELCRRWDRKQYDLVVLLRLRERKVQQIKDIADLFAHIDRNLQQLVTKGVLGREGKGVLFILDGYDELPLKLRHQGLLLHLLKGEVLPSCSVLVTSRPSATGDLLMACSPQIQRHVEILGFTQICVRDYASSVFSSEPEVLKDFMTYISASKNPAINSLMYIPLNAAIIVHIYRNSRRKSFPMPKTLTQVYMQLCLTLLMRHIQTKDPQNTTILHNFSDISTPYSNHLQCLSWLAFNQFEQEKIVFYSDSVPNELIHFGFLDCVPALYCGGGVSYNFLHLTLQEFLAAYHITQLPNGISIDVFKHHFKDKRWEVVWRFVSGLTGFQYFIDSVRCDAFVPLSKGGEYLEIKNLLLHCLFEGQLMFDYKAALKINKLFSEQNTRTQVGSSPLDRYALGYCIANCSSATLWKITMEGGSAESFMWGLNSNHGGSGVISHLIMRRNVSPTCLESYPSNISIRHLGTNAEADMLEQVLPKINNLTSLHVYNLERPALLNAISQTNVTTLTFDVYALLSDQAFQSSLHGLVNSPSNKLKDLTIECFDSCNTSIKTLCDILFGPSSLNHLSLLELPNFTDDSFDLLKTNTCLTTLHISTAIKTQSLQPLNTILLNNKTIENLRWGCSSLLKAEILTEQVQTLITALSSNTTLKELTLDIQNYYESVSLSKLIRDSRVRLPYTFKFFR